MASVSSIGQFWANVIVIDIHIFPISAISPSCLWSSPFYFSGIHTGILVKHSLALHVASVNTVVSVNQWWASYPTKIPLLHFEIGIVGQLSYFWVPGLEHVKLRSCQKLQCLLLPFLSVLLSSNWPMALHEFKVYSTMFWNYPYKLVNSHHFI